MPATGFTAAIGICAVAAHLVAFASPALSQPADPPQGGAARHAEIAARIADAGAALERATAELEGLRAAKRELEEALQRIESRAAVYALGREFAVTLTERLRRLPRAEHFSPARQERARLLAATSDANIRAERTLAGLRVPEVDTEPALAAQRGLLTRLTELQYRLLRVLQESEEATREFEQQIDKTRAKVTQLLFWVPAPPSLQTMSALMPSLAWTVSRSRWQTAVADLWNEFRRGPLGPAIALLAAAGLYAARRRLQRALVALSPATVTYRRYRIGHALAALAITFALALPGPLVLDTAASLLIAASESQPFTQALGDALQRVARLVVGLSAFAWLLDRRGMAVAHFGWDGAAAAFVASAVRRFAVLFVPLVAIVALNGLENAPYANRESFGRLGFILAMVALAAFLAHLLRREKPLIRLLFERAPRSAAARLHGLWRSALVAWPIGLAGLAAAGYFIAAEYFFGRTMQSLFLVFAAVLLFGLIALWVRVQRYHLRRRQEQEAARSAEEGAGEEAVSGVAEVRPPELDVVALGEQTKSLLHLLITLLLLGGLWWIWKDAFPVLSVISDYVLWTYASADNVKNSVTVGGVTLAILIGVVTAVAVRNVGALLDIVLLQRIDMAADATYAIKVVARYVLAGVGIVLASRILGIAWGDVHWLIAAMGVGLGFGLQEIVANFISGLILLAERPIRIGDVITVGDMSGTVARIRARATAVVDFDNKEVIIPNRAFITERVVNWTLSNRITRLLLPIGVAYGSDIALVQRVVLEAVRSVPDVLEDPTPSVYFSAFGDSSLDFEIRAFVDSFDKRIRVRHEIQLAVARALSENGIEIPFPQRDLHIRSAPGLSGAPGFRQGG